MLSHINPQVDTVEVNVTFWDQSGPPHNSIDVTFYIDVRDWSLSELKGGDSAGKSLLSARRVLPPAFMSCTMTSIIQFLIFCITDCMSAPVLYLVAP
jgi:hypothetical protein